MAVEAPGLDVGYLTANADLSAKQYLAVAVSGADFQVNVVGNGVKALGVLQNAPTSGQAADVRVIGVSKAVAGAAYARGVMLMSNASGQLITATSTNYAVAYSLEAAAASGELRSVYVIGAPSGQYA
jgi:Uncharacterized conserved protein (DUF2190)